LIPETRLRLRQGALAALLALSGCELRQAMFDQPRYEPLEASAFFADGGSARAPVKGTIARGQLRLDRHFYEGKADTGLATALPMPVTRELLERGHERFDIYCSPCHDRLGTGRGMVVRRGFPQAASFHIDRLHEVEAGYLFDVASRGFGRMSGYAAQIPVNDRWAIVAYVRALQLSQHAPAAELSPGEIPRLESEEATAR